MYDESNLEIPKKTESKKEWIDKIWEEKTEIEIELKNLYDSPHRQTNKWNTELDLVLRRYLKLMNKRLFRKL